MRKSIFKFISIGVFALMLCFSPAIFAGCNGNNELTNTQKVERIVENTRASILEVNDSIIQKYNSDEQTSVSANSNLPTNMDRTLNESVYLPVQQLTISFGYFALSEYFAEYMQSDFLDKTLYVNQTIYPQEDIYTKFSLNDNSFEIYIYAIWEGSFNEYLNISVFYDQETYTPTKFIHRENRHLNDGRNMFGYIEVDFTSNDCLIETTYFENGNEDYSNATDEFLNENLTRYVREEFNFENYKDRTTITSYDQEVDNLFEYVRNFDYVYEQTEKSNFNIVEAENYSDGDNAMCYSFDKYLIREDEYGNLTKVY